MNEKNFLCPICSSTRFEPKAQKSIAKKLAVLIVVPVAVLLALVFVVHPLIAVGASVLAGAVTFAVLRRLPADYRTMFVCRNCGRVLKKKDVR